MPFLNANDGTRLCYSVNGEGSTLVCLPGGPMLPSAYLGDLGGLSGRQRLIMVDNRGTGGSQPPRDPGTYRCDSLVEDVEALREHLDLARIDLLAHSGGANLALLYTVRHPERIGKLVLVTPSVMAVGIEVTGAARREVVLLRKHEPWFAPAMAAYEAIAAERATEADWEAITPFTYGRWDATARAHSASMDEQRNEEAAAVYGEEGAFDPPTTRAALATFGAPVLLLAGERDVAAPPRVMADLAGLFPSATLTTQSGAGHFPWLDDPTWFSTTIADFLQ